jgi:GR25 family glycosyltransferase involved in LPS biosynthesis
MEGQLSKVGLKAIRHRGKKPQEYNLDDPKYRVMLNRTPGAIACHEGQVDIMKTAQSIGSHALVMEDDIIFCEDFNKRLDYIDNWTMTHNWDIVWLGASFHVNPPYWHKFGQSGMPPDCSAQLGYDIQTTNDPRMIRTYGAYVTFAYIVNKESIQRITDYLEWFLPQSIGIDYAMIAAAKYRPEFKFFSFVPGCVMQMDNMSDIGSGMTMWSGQLNNGPYVFQKLMTDFNPETFKWS